MDEIEQDLLAVQPEIPATADPLEKRVLAIIQSKIGVMRNALADESGDWAIRGFIDTYKDVFPMTPDTKVVSKVFEVLLIPVFLEAIKDTGLEAEFAAHQNHYPDITVIDPVTKQRVAIDLKSTYLVSSTRVNGFTLGAFTGYFRDRESTKNTLYPYSQYAAHLVLGVIYKKNPEQVINARKFSIDEIDKIPAVAGGFQFLIQPKWAIATDMPGSGNTKNIGSVRDLERLLKGTGPFSEFKDPEEVFDDYWRHYLTVDMARAAETVRPYRNLVEYLEYKKPPRERV